MVKHGDFLYVVKNENIIYGCFKYYEDAKIFKEIILKGEKAFNKRIPEIIINRCMLYEMVDTRNLKKLLKG